MFWTISAVKQQFRLQTWSFISEINGTVRSKTMAFLLQLFSPWNNQTRAELALKSSFFQLRLGQKQAHLFRTDTLPLSRSGSHAIQNIPWPLRLFNRAHIGVSPTQLTFRWQFCPQRIFMATLIGRSAATRFWVAKIGANPVGKVFRPAGAE